MVGATEYGPDELPALRVRGLSVERGQSARLGLDLTRTQVPIAQLYEAGKVPLLSRARGLLNPIEWEDPFGMVIIETMALASTPAQMGK